MFAFTVPDPCMTPPRKAGRSLSSMFHTFLYLHMTCGDKHSQSLHRLTSLFLLLRRNKPQSPAKSRETPHRRTARQLSWTSYLDLSRSETCLLYLPSLLSVSKFRWPLSCLRSNRSNGRETEIQVLEFATAPARNYEKKNRYGSLNTKIQSIVGRLAVQLS